MFRLAAVRTTRVVVGRRYASTKVSVQNLETRWKTLSTAEQNTVAKHLEELQKGDWKALTAEEKKAAYFLAFGPHGPRTPRTTPGHPLRVFFGVCGTLSFSGFLYLLMRMNGQEHPETLSKEWQEATNEYLRSQNSNPVHGISSEGYKGKGYVSWKPPYESEN
ncbi:Cytochrome c oxidase subunit 5A [Apophysomyces sp. BC1034]|nr:Cytochrome c oxidase subunit 5A [Apophysomyces sp. BC1021]KAG0174901.1 Cytochrome c oxidase subunit 5A [Apophysomyces sp. BC1015]KAG0191197.1 Cytochrome c oxidase subunit 5A [Apophysomyces sp. BC1034]